MGAMSKQLSSRLQGLKFMQRKAAQAPADTEDVTAHEASAPAAEASASTPTTQEQWVMPDSARVRVARQPPAPKAIHWDAWLTDALDETKETRPTTRRRVFGKWDKPAARHAESEDEFASDDDDDDDDDEEERYASAHSDLSSPEPGFRKPPSASGPPTTQRKRVAQDQGNRRRKLASVASSQQSLRKTKKDTVKRLR